MWTNPSKRYDFYKWKDTVARGEETLGRRRRRRGTDHCTCCTAARTENNTSSTAERENSFIFNRIKRIVDVGLSNSVDKLCQLLSLELSVYLVVECRWPSETMLNAMGISGNEGRTEVSLFHAINGVIQDLFTGNVNITATSWANPFITFHGQFQMTVYKQTLKAGSHLTLAFASGFRSMQKVPIYLMQTLGKNTTTCCHRLHSWKRKHRRYVWT